MASSAAIVNQRLYIVRLQLDHYHQAQDAQQLAQTNLEQCYGVSVVFQLCRCYWAYLQELADQYRIPVDTHLANAEQLSGFMHAQQNQSLEITELLDLEDSGWIKDLFNAYQQSLIVEESTSNQSKKSNRGAMIAVTQIKQASPFILQTCQTFYQQLKMLIERQREMYVEY